MKMYYYLFLPEKSYENQKCLLVYFIDSFHIRKETSMKQTGKPLIDFASRVFKNELI